MTSYDLRSNTRKRESLSNSDIFDSRLFEDNKSHDIQDSEDSEDSTEFFTYRRSSHDINKSKSNRKRRSDDAIEEIEDHPVKKRRGAAKDNRDRISLDSDPVIPLGNRLFEILTNNNLDDDYETDDSWKKNLSEREIIYIETQLNEIRENISKNDPTIPKILQSDMTKHEKERAIQIYDILQNTDQRTADYIMLRNELIEMIRTAKVECRSDGRILRNRRISPNRQISRLNEELNSLRAIIESEIPTLNKLLLARLPKSDKIHGLQLYDQLHHVVHGSAEWYNIQTEIQKILKLELSSTEEVELIETQEEKCKRMSFNHNLDIRMKILSLDAPDNVKTQIYDMYLSWTSMDKESSSYNSLTTKLNWLVQLPYNHQMILKTYENPRDYCVEIYKNLNKEIYGMKDAKERLIQIINNRFYGDNPRSIIALKGKPGVGKTKLAKSLANAVGLPFDKISLGGAIDSTIFRGSDGVWVGSSPSVIIQTLARTKYANPIILLDEIDKLASERGGYDVQNSLLHILDYTQNKEFKDAYLCDFSHDISNIWFIVTMNDDSKLDPALKDRLDIIEIPSYNKIELKEIINRHILPESLKSVGLADSQIIITNEACDKLLQLLSSDIEITGVRPIEKAINTIISRINLFRSVKEGDIELTYTVPQFNGFPYNITAKNIDEIYPISSNNTSLTLMYI